MAGIRKLPYTDHRQSFRSRLQRALSLLPSESEVIRSPSGSAAGDTTEDEASVQENDNFGNERIGISADYNQESPSPHRCRSPRSQNELELPRQHNISGDCSMIALQCVAESMQKSLDNQNSWIVTIRSDLEDIRSRLAVVETTMEMVAKEGENDTTMGIATRRTLRSQQ
ncbi:hypothetical protein CBS147333_9195 [Penicillium roqueforti]|nr:hypothetical protein CBS147333_9195 [Penicillium roqueforti]KAI3261736.1 hypothetical protein CBS147308_9663 [Penicillium roqueforti]KAI3279449.1 hypothetical protein DTO003C3_9774 [Penicillium roqueforti]